MRALQFSNEDAQRLVGRVLSVGGLPYTVTSASIYGEVRVYDPTKNEYLFFDSRETFENWAYGTPVSTRMPEQSS